MPAIATTIQVGECNTKVNAWATHTDRPFVDVVLESRGGHAEIRLQFSYEDDIDYLAEALGQARYAFLQPSDQGDEWHSWVMFGEEHKARSRAERGLPPCETTVIR